MTVTSSRQIIRTGRSTASHRSRPDRRASRPTYRRNLKMPLYRQPRWSRITAKARCSPRCGTSPPTPARSPAWPPRAAPGRRDSSLALRGAESFWDILGCIGFGVGDFSETAGQQGRRAKSSANCSWRRRGLSRSYSLRGAETFWYVLMCLAFGGGYFAKVSAKKALWEVTGMVQSAPGEYAEAIRRAFSGALRRRTRRGSDQLAPDRHEVGPHGRG